jgi:hypothetical protein
MERFPTSEVMTAASGVVPRCMYCGGVEGHAELLDTGDDESLDGFEVWFCCHRCRDAGRPCETFHRLEAT